MADDKKFSEWHGIPRNRIRWNPTVDKNKCVGCGMCITGCGRNVYDWDLKSGKPISPGPFYAQGLVSWVSSLVVLRLKKGFL